MLASQGAVVFLQEQKCRLPDLNVQPSLQILVMICWPISLSICIHFGGTPLNTALPQYSVAQIPPLNLSHRFYLLVTILIDQQLAHIIIALYML